MGRFGEADSGLLATIAANVSVAIQNARLFEAQHAPSSSTGASSRRRTRRLHGQARCVRCHSWHSVYISPRVEQVFGYPRDAWLEEASPDQCSCPRIRRALSVVRSPTSKPATKTLVHRVSRSRGGRASGLGPRRRAWIVRDEQGAPTHLQGFVVDIHRAGQAAAELDRQKQYFESHVEISPVAIVVMDMSR